MIPCIGGPLDGREVDDAEHNAKWLQVAGQEAAGTYERVGLEFLWRPAGTVELHERPMQPLDRRKWAAAQAGSILLGLTIPQMRLLPGEILWFRYPGTLPESYRITIVDVTDGAWCEFDFSPALVNLAIDPASALRRAIDEGLAKSRAGG